MDDYIGGKRNVLYTDPTHIPRQWLRIQAGLDKRMENYIGGKNNIVHHNVLYPVTEAGEREHMLTSNARSCAYSNNVHSSFRENVHTCTYVRMYVRMYVRKCMHMFTDNAIAYT